jgi:hypothetical protein
MKKFILSVVREISIVWTDAKLDALSRRETELFNADGKVPNSDSIELQVQIEEISRVINDVVEKIELFDRKLSSGN